MFRHERFLDPSLSEFSPTSLTQGEEENRTRETMLFTISNSWPICFGVFR